ncbi:MAG: GDSL-type esterase/lipase family protein [Solirubrobacteraceae bacterium]
MAAAADADLDCRLGVLAFGDSITNAGGELQWGVALQSWALWVARGLGMPYTGYAVDGARIADVVDGQIPAFERLTASPGARYDVGCLYIGVNDVRGADWDADAFAAGFERALGYLSARCARTLAVIAPLRLGFPPAHGKVGELNDVVRAAASRQGALVVDLEPFGARNQVMVDRVHPTAFGQIAIAERALAVLERDGLPTRAHPSALINVQRTRWGALRGDWTYVYRNLKQRVRVDAGARANYWLGKGSRAGRGRLRRRAKRL